MTVADVLGCGTKKKRRSNPHQLFETQAAHTRALLHGFMIPRSTPIWEPCAGRGAIADMLRAQHYPVVESDIVKRRPRVLKRSFFDFKQPLARTVITNPPYRHAARFIRHAHILQIKLLILLLKADFMNTAQRFNLALDVGMPTHILGLIKRPDFTGEGSPPMVCSWYVWDEWHANRSVFSLLDNRK